MNGTVEALTPDWRGATLLTAVGSVLTVDDIADFDEEGGWLTIADAAPLEYVAVDEDADTVTLAGAAGTVEAGDPVVIWDPTVPPSGAKVVEYLASVMTDRGPVDAVLEHEKIPLAGVDTLVGASVSLAEDDYGSPYVDQVLGREPLLDGSFIDPTSTIPGGQAFSLDAPTDTDGYPEDYGWWQVDASNNVLGFWRLVGGVWTAQEFDIDGALFATNGFIEYLNGKVITGPTIQTRGTPDRGIKLGTVSGAINYDEAFIVFKESGEFFIKAVPSEDTAVFAGKMTADTQTVSDGSSLGGVTEITRATDGTAGAIRLTGYTTAPKSAPIVTTGYDTVQFTDDGKWADRRGWSTDGTYWYTVLASSDGYVVEKWTAGALVAASTKLTWRIPHGVVVTGGTVYVLELFSATSSFYVQALNATTLAYVSTAGWVEENGTRAPALGLDPASGELIIAQSKDADDKVRIRRYTFPAGIGQNLTLVGTFVDTAFAYDKDLSGVTYGAHDLGANRYVFSGDTAINFRVANTSGTAVTAEDFQSGMAAKVGFTYTGGAFVSMDTSGLMRTYTGQDKATAIGDAALTKWVSNELVTTSRTANVVTNGTTTVTATAGTFISADVGSTITGTGFSGGTTITGFTSSSQVTISATATAGTPTATIGTTLQTDQSPRAKITIPKRTKLNVTTSAINTGGANAPDRVRIFVGQGSTDPGRTAMWKQTDPAVGVITTAYSSLATSGTNPVATNGFAAAAGTVQGLQGADGTVFIDALGAIPASAFRDAVRAAAGASGTVNITTGAAGTVTTQAITFPASRFSAAPVVTVSVETTRPDLNMATPSAITASGCNISAYRNAASATLTIHWQAKVSG